jgi:hypothetical protein
VQAIGGAARTAPIARVSLALQGATTSKETRFLPKEPL